METWRVADELEMALPEDLSAVTIRVVAGDVTVAAAPAGVAPTLAVRRDSGADVTVELGEGGLFVSQPDPDQAPITRIVKMLTEGTRHRAHVLVTAPAGATVNVTTVSATAMVTGFDSTTKIKTVSGEVTLSGLRHEVSVSTVSGDVGAKAIAAGLKIKTVSGDIGVADGTCRFVDAKSVSGDVLLDLDLDPSGTYDVSTVSGDVSVRTIADPNLVVEATSVSGSLASDFGISWENRPGRRSVSSTIGAGGARLWVKTVSGDLRVLRGRAAA